MRTDTTNHGDDDMYEVNFDSAIPASPAHQEFPTLREALEATEQRGPRCTIGEVCRDGQPLTLKNLRNEWRWSGGDDVSSEEQAAILAGQEAYAEEVRGRRAGK